MPRSRDVLWLACLAAGCERAGSDNRTIELATPEVEVKLLDAGREPRAVLVAHPAAGTHGTYTATMSTDYEIAGDPRPGSTMSETYTVEVVDVSGEGVNHVREIVTAASVVPHPGAAPLAHATDPASYIGRALDQWRDGRNRDVRPTRITLKADAAYDDESRSIEGLEIAPEEPIGVGARWHGRVVVGGHVAEIDNELVSRDGERSRIRMTYHRDRNFQGGLTGIEDGDAVVDQNDTTFDFALHKTATFTLHTPRGDVIGRETIDIARAP